MEYFRTKKTGELVYLSESKRFPTDTQPPGECVYRVRDGHALWGYTRKDLITEIEWLKQNKQKKLKPKSKRT